MGDKNATSLCPKNISNLVEPPKYFGNRLSTSKFWQYKQYGNTGFGVFKRRVQNQKCYIPLCSGGNQLIKKYLLKQNWLYLKDQSKPNIYNLDKRRERRTDPVLNNTSSTQSQTLNQNPDRILEECQCKRSQCTVEIIIPICIIFTEMIQSKKKFGLSLIDLRCSGEGF